jgi:hypothetical protein
MASSTVGRAAQSLGRAARQEGERCHLPWLARFHSTSVSANECRTHIQLRNLPRTALPSDVRRLAVRAKLKGVADGVPFAFLPSRSVSKALWSFSQSPLIITSSVPLVERISP